MAGFFLADGDGDASAVAVFFLVAAFSVVEVAVVAVDFLVVADFLVVDAECVVTGVVVSFLWAQETKNATLKRTVIITRTDFFIDMWVRLRPLGCSVSEQTASN